MSDLELFPQTNVENNTVVEIAEIESIQDAAHEPGERIEETQSFVQSEAVESALTVAVAEDVNNPLQPPEMAGAPQESPKIAQDPLTGKSYGGEQDHTSGSNSSDNNTAQAVTADGEGRVQASSGAIKVTAENSGHPAEQIPASEIDGNDPVYRFDGEIPATGAVGKENTPGDKVGRDFDHQRLGPENLPQKEKMPVGMGKDGALFPGGGKNFPGSGQGKMPQGSSTNGGGPPVGNYGSGSKGKGGKTQYWGEVDGNHVEGSSNQSCQREAVRVSKYSEISKDGNIIVQCEDGSQYQLYWENYGDIEVSKRGMTIDGDQPVPYTGVWTSGEDPDPKTPIGGLDRESGKVHPVLAGGNAKSGGKTPGDKDGDDDSGHFMGDPNLSGGDDYVPPPDDDIPYQKLNQLNGAF